MQNTIAQTLASVVDAKSREALRQAINALADRLSSQMHSSAGLVIKAALGVLAKAGSACYGTANGKPFTIAANTDMASLVGTVAQNTHNVYAFYVDQDGTLTTLMGTGHATLSQVKFPQTPVGKTIIGYIKVNPTAADFIGGTTALDAASTNVLYVNITGACDPTVVL